LTKGENEGKVSFITKLYTEIAITFGDPDGKITPMALAYIFIKNKELSIVLKQSVRMLFNESSCSFAEAQNYAKYMIEFAKKSNKTNQNPCHPVQKSVCCGYFGQLASKQLEMTLLTLKYSIPHYITSHKPLADMLGLGPDSTVCHFPPFCPLTF
jgi:hypothetical protein